MILTLLKKDFRLNRPIIIGGASMTVGIYLLGMILTFQLQKTDTTLANALYASAMLANGMVSILAGVLGAATFAVERRERSADFVALLPVHRFRILASKFVAVAAVIAIFWAINLTTAFFLEPTLGGSLGFRADHWNFIFPMAVAVLAFGTGWLFSTFLSSAPISFAIAGGAMAISFLLIAVSGAKLDPRKLQVDQYDFWWSICGGLASMAAGTFIYLRRVEP